MNHNVQKSVESSNRSPISQKSAIREPPLSVPREFVGMFISRALDKIAAERETKKPANVELLDACRDAVIFLRTRVGLHSKSSDKTRSTDAYMPPTLSDGGALLDNEKLLLPFELACKSKSCKVVITSLDCFQKLIAYGHVPNDAFDSTGKTRLIERIVEAICSCFNGVSTDDGVQLQIIKALLTVVISPIVEVHEHYVLMIVQTCYNICMATKNFVNQTTARATLTQMVNVIFQRMEPSSLGERHIDNCFDPDKKKCDLPCQKAGENSVGHSGKDLEISIKDENNDAISSHCSYSSEELETFPISSNDHNHTDKCKSGDNFCNETETILNSNKASEANETSEPSEANEVLEADEASELSKANEVLKPSEADEASELSKADEGPELSKANEVSEVSETDETSELSKANEVSKASEADETSELSKANEVSKSSEAGETSELSKANEVSKSSEADETSELSKANEVSEPPETNDAADNKKEVDMNQTTNDISTPKPELVSPSASLSTMNSETMDHYSIDSAEEFSSSDVYQKDAFLLFRSLCRLAMKPLAGNNPTDPRSHELRSKILSLQLLSNIVEQPGPAFKSDTVFITAIKQHLCAVLSMNGKSTVLDVFELSLTIFIYLLTHFKQHLKIQIEMFFKDVLFNVIEMSNASYEFKWIVIEALQRICSDKQCIVDAYLNYDCDLERTNIFEKLVIYLSKIAQGGHSVDTRATPIQLQNLRKKGLESLVLILKGMVLWSSDLFNVSNDAQSLLGSEPRKASTNVKNDDFESVSSVSVSNFVQDDPEAFESRKAQKEVYELGIYHFNRGEISKGLALLQDSHLLGNSAEEVAMFLHVESRLCRTAIGDFLGENETFALEVMYAYVDCVDFTGVEFVPALRHFLSGFRLPGEAQKIDRLMEKFAARYYTCNPCNTHFASADTAYVLAFSVIMLTTDLHSAKIKPKQRMSKEDYIKMNRGINDSQDLPREFLSKIYDEIAQCEIQIRSNNKPLGMVANGNATNTTNGVTTGVRDLMESVSHVESEFTSATHFEHVRPMFKLVWTPFLAAFSVGLQDCDDLLVSRHCLEGIQCAIRIACIFRMELERDAYVQALARFTLLLSTSQQQGGPGIISGQDSGVSGPFSTLPRVRPDPSQSPTVGVANSPLSSPVSEISPIVNPTPETMKSKNVDSIRSLIAVAHTDGNYLGRSWLHILRCISQLESANVIATNTARSLPRQRHGSHSTMTSPEEANSSTAAESPGKRKRSSLAQSGSLAAAAVDSRNAAVLQEVMGETGSHSVVVAVDKVFSGSIRLDGDAIVDFVKALCQVSLEELSLPQPRTFSLQKVVEISYYNIGRIRLQLSRIWEHVGQHFLTAGRSANEDVALFAVDSLRQLSVKLIERGELPNFHFQKEFLRPFLNILDDLENVEPIIQDMVVRCASQLIQSQWKNLRSGWTNVFLVLYTAAASREEGVIELAFSSCSFVINTVFPQNLPIMIDSFPVFIKALAEFACNLHFPDTSMEAIRLIRVCARVVSERCHLFACEESANPSKCATVPSDEAVSISQHDCDSRGGGGGGGEEEDLLLWKRGWKPILYELFRVINNCKLDVRTRALTVFFEILKSCGSTFRLTWWMQVFKLIFSIFEHGRDTSCSVTPKNPKEGFMSHQDGRSRRLFSGDHQEAFGITYRVFSSPTDRSEWLNTTCNHALYSVVDIFSQFFDRIGDSLMVNLYEQLKWCCLQDHEQLARSGTSCLETIVLTNGSKFDEEKWRMTVDLIADLFQSTVPSELLTWRPDQMADETSTDKTPPKRLQPARTCLFLRLLINCIVQYELIQTVDNIVFFSARSRHEDGVILREAKRCSAQLNSQLLGEPLEAAAPQVVRTGGPSLKTAAPEGNTLLTAVARVEIYLPNSPSLDVSNDDVLVNGSLPLDKKATFSYISYENHLLLVQCLLNSHNFAKSFNSNIEQRNILWEAGFKAKAKPNLLKQETHSLSTALRILFRLSGEEHERRKEIIELLEKIIKEAIMYYRSLPVDGHRQAWDSCLLLILTRLVNLPLDEQFSSLSCRLYSTICDLVGLPNLTPELSVLLRAFLLRKNA